MQSLFEKTNSTRSCVGAVYCTQNWLYTLQYYVQRNKVYASAMYPVITWWFTVTWWLMFILNFFLEMFMNNFPGVPLLNLWVNIYNLIIKAIITKSELVPIRKPIIMAHRKIGDRKIDKKSADILDIDLNHL